MSDFIFQILSGIYTSSVLKLGIPNLLSLLMLHRMKMSELMCEEFELVRNDPTYLNEID